MDILARQRQFTIFTLNFPAGSQPTLGVSHHLEVNRNSGTSKHPMQSWCSLIPVLPTLAGTIFTRWYSEVLIYTVQHLSPPRDRTTASVNKAKTTIRPPAHLCVWLYFEPFNENEITKWNKQVSVTYGGVILNDNMILARSVQISFSGVFSK